MNDFYMIQFSEASSSMKTFASLVKGEKLLTQVANSTIADL